MRGVAQITAATIVAEIGDLGRFDTSAGSWRISGSYLRAFQLSEDPASWHHQGRKCPSPSAASRERMDLLSFSARQRGDAASSGGA
ncbi:transposase [Rhizobium lusitanum]|uniref:Transposase n=1 Tax=Rhizobium lusitanum TaxID=293958 RepID=A0A6L9U8N6_9HYPH|nr:transposase [Rhizobium lusitanum]